MLISVSQSDATYHQAEESFNWISISTVKAFPGENL